MKIEQNNSIKRIDVADLKIGMHVKEFCSNWIDNPFWRNSFVITSENELEKIRHSSVKEVIVYVEIPSAPEPRDEDKRPLIIIADKIESNTLKRVSIEEELKKASILCAGSKKAVAAMFEEVRMGKAVDSGLAQQLVEDITNSVARNPGALISLARLKTADDYTYMHSVAVCAMMVALAKQLSLDEKETRLCGIAGLMHDLGKIAMPAEILNKPGKLTEDEFKIIKSHPTEGHKLLVTASDISDLVLDVCLHHHEKMDGSGYPDGLEGHQISLHSKMGAVCDVYDAITSNRPYKAGWDPSESIQKMAQWSGHFDPAVFQAFVKSIGIYPIGSLVRMESGRLGIVVDQTEKSLTTPMVKVFFSLRSEMRIPPILIDLSKTNATDRIVAREDPAVWKFNFLNDLWSVGVAK